MSSLWVDKYKPKNSSELLGQSNNVSRIKSWLKNFESKKSRPLFIHGPPGIGKTTAAHVICKECGYQVLEFNASDQRNKNIVKEVMSSCMDNSCISFFTRASETKQAIILDEIDGMAGNEDRGGIAQILLEMKKSKKPLIFICNDGQHQKLRTLREKCEIVEFKRPGYDTIKSIVARIANREDLDLKRLDIQNLTDSTEADIRQIINLLSLFKENFTSGIAKTTRLNAFEATKKALTNNQHSISDRFDCFFADYNIMPLFIFENYHTSKPFKGDHLRKVSWAANSLCLSDLAEKEIRSHQNWSLLNAQALLSTVIPSKLMASNQFGRVNFPQFLGKLSNANKRLRLTQELNGHMCLTLRKGLDPEYLEVMRMRLGAPLTKQDAVKGIDSVIDFMHAYSLTREDFDSIMELSSWSFLPDIMSKVSTKTKTAFTLAFKKRSVALPYFVDDKTTKKRKTNYSQDYDDKEDDEEEAEAETDPVIKPKRVFKNEKPTKKAKVRK